ncbi:MAG: toprim domain-containing protein, partial [Pseudomonadota bacterium]
GGVVRLGPPGPVIALAEGLETALSVWTRSGIPCWSALSAAGIGGFDLDLLPPNTPLLIAADHDETGWLAALNLLTRARQTGRAAAVVMPKRVGEDFNDLVRPQPETRDLLPV